MLKYKLFLLDADDTLFDYNAAETQALSEVFGDYGLAFGTHTLAEYRRINAALWKQRECGLISLDELKFRRFDELLAGWVDVEAFSRQYLRRLAGCSQLVDGAEEVCAELVRRGGRLILFTNGIADVQRRRIEASPINGLFAGLAISEEVGVQKPDARMTFAAMEIAGHSERETVLVVGDSLRADVGAAAAAGVDSCLVCAEPPDLPSCSSEDKPSPTYVISHIRELLEII